MEEITPETLIEMGKEMEDIFLAGLPIEKRLEGLGPKDIFKFYKPEERLEGLTTEEIEAIIEKRKKKSK